MATSKEPPQSGATVIAGSRPPSVGPAVVVASGRSDDLVGSVLADRYKILKRLGEGGMGTVYLAEHTTIHKKLAIKVLSSDYCHKQDLVDRFLQEARAASLIEHENVVEITDYGSTPGGSVFFVMEFLQGEDLSDTVKREGPLPWARVRSIMVQICRALAAAHEKGIIHRDMKPENCYRIRRGSNEDFIKVLDFGIAKVTTEDGDGGKGLTRTGMIFGTPEYMSPEQAQGARPDHRVDVYAIGIIMYELLTGRVPFTADTFMGILTKHMFEIPEAPSAIAPHMNISQEVEAIILKALQKDREYRFQNMKAMADAIDAVGTGAAAVAVVHENIAKPSDGRFGFTHGATPNSGTFPPQVGTYPPAPDSGTKSKLPIVAALVGLALVGAGVAAFATGGFDANEPVPSASAAIEPVATATPVETPADPPAKTSALDVRKVTFKIRTQGIDAHILDARDEGMYGKTNDPNGIQVEETNTPLELILRADGYQDLEFSILPDQDKTFEKQLIKQADAPKPIKKPEPKKPEPKKPEPKKSEPKKPEPKKPEPAKVKPIQTLTPAKPAGPKPNPSPDLKDPFRRG